MEIVGKLINTAKWYKEEIVNKPFIFTCENKDGKVNTIKLVFKPFNFLNLSGFKFMNENGNEKEYASREFYRRCTHMPYITPQELNIPRGIGFYEYKKILYRLDSLKYITQVKRFLKVVDDDFENDKPDYIIGNNIVSLRISYDKETETYYPLSILNQSIYKCKLNYEKCKLLKN